MKPSVLQLCTLDPASEKRLRATCELLPGWQAGALEQLSAAQCEAISGIVTAAPIGVPAALFDRLPGLRVVSSRGVGLDRIDLECARARGIQVSATFGVLSACVADLAFALLLDIGRRVSEADRFVRAGRWTQARFPLSRRVSGKRLGIVGLGSIGAVIAQRAIGFDMPVRYTGRAAKRDVAYPFEPSVEELARWADFLVIAVSGGPATRHLVSGAVLDALGPTGCIVNIARGSVIDTDALVAALAEGRIAGAALDVFDNEPEVPAALLELENVVLSPHVASSTEETRQALEDLALANIEAFYSAGAVLTPVP